MALNWNSIEKNLGRAIMVGNIILIAYQLKTISQAKSKVLPEGEVSIVDERLIFERLEPKYQQMLTEWQNKLHETLGFKVSFAKVIEFAEKNRMLSGEALQDIKSKFF